jgi:dTDP-4-amino-4,6-dideoxygalactose transaminase
MWKNDAWEKRSLPPFWGDIAAAIGIHQLRRAEGMREQREAIAAQYFQQLGDVDEIELPEDPPNRIHSWHLFAGLSSHRRERLRSVRQMKTQTFLVARYII